jgi:hypothetical protein
MSPCERARVNSNKPAQALAYRSATKDSYYE